MADVPALDRLKLSKVVAREAVIDSRKARQLTDQILAMIGDTLEGGDDVKITGFGTFKLNDKGERTGRNPRTGVEAPIPPMRVVTFVACAALRSRIESN